MPYFRTYNPKEGMEDIYDADSLTRLIHDNIKYYQDAADTNMKRANKSYDEVRKNVTNDYEEENKLLKRKLALAYRFFNSSKESLAFDVFEERHKACYKNANKIDSGKMCYLIPYGTGIGTAYTAVCPICGAKENITDSGDW